MRGGHDHRLPWPARLLADDEIAPLDEVELVMSLAKTAAATTR